MALDATAQTVTLKPNTVLAANTQYTATLTGGTTGIKDMANNPLTNVSWTFITGAAPDTTAPTVTTRSPGNSAINVGRTGDITATFNEAVGGVSGTTFR